MKKPYLIVTPDYVEQSAGIRVMHKLVSLLNARGHEAYSSAVVTGYPGERVPHSQAKFEWLAKVSIVIYPDIVHGNPLNSRYVVRYALNTPGRLGGDAVYPPDVPCFAYSNLFAPALKRCDGVVQIETIEEDIFTNHGSEARPLTCWYMGKAEGRVVRVDAAETGYQITRFPRWPNSRRALADLFNKSHALYTYDGCTALMDEARLCGCPVVVMPNYEWTREKLGEQPGLAFNMNDLPLASNTVGKYREWRAARLPNIDAQIEKFTSFTQGYYAA